MRFKWPFKNTEQHQLEVLDHTFINGEHHVDKMIIDTKKHPQLEAMIKDVYQSRWVWYHTLLAGLLVFTNLLLLAIFVLLSIKL